MRYVEARLPDEAETWDELILIPIGDVHIGSPWFDEARFISLLEWIRQAPNRFAVINGDLWDMALIESKGSPYEATMRPRDANRYARAKLEPIRDRILAWTSGNHEERLSRFSDLDTGEILSEELGIPFDREGIVMKIAFGHSHRGSRRRTAYFVHMTHGASSARTLGGKANHMQQHADIWEGIDLFISGHTHWKAGVKEVKKVPDPYNNTIREREVVYVNNSTFLRWGGYAERRAYRPAALGPPHVVLSGARKEVKVIL